MGGLLLECCPERFKVRFQESDVAPHNAEMRYLLTFHPQVHGLNTDAKVDSCIANREGKLWINDG
jgi:hypothetical protein